jgi:RoxA-like, cytochrome c-like
MDRWKSRRIGSRCLAVAVGIAAVATVAGGRARAQDGRARLVEGASDPRLQRLAVPDSPEGLCGGEPCEAVARGLFHFFDRSPDGMAANGRSCADCHMVTDRFQLTPARVEQRFQFLQWLRQFNPNADDPLFRPLDADDFRTNGQDASDYSNLRQNGLVRISFDLPQNMKLIDPATNLPSAETFVDVWRSVPTVNDVKLTGPDGQNPWPRDPNRTGGYQLDARVATLQEQALGALVHHAEVPHAPAQQFLDDLHSFQRVLFTNDRVRALADAIDAGASPLPDPDPPLNQLEQQGKVVFTRACAQCHGGPTQTLGVAPVIRYHDIASQCPRPVDTVTPPRFLFTPCPQRLVRNARTYEIGLINGTIARRTSSDPARALLTGFVGGPAPQDDWNKFDVPALRGISKTAPYFHNNSEPTLEAVVNHYIQFFKRVQANAPPGTVPPIATTDGVHFDRIPLPEEVPALLAYLRKL